MYIKHMYILRVSTCMWVHVQDHTHSYSNMQYTTMYMYAMMGKVGENDPSAIAMQKTREMVSNNALPINFASTKL